MKLTPERLDEYRCKLIMTGNQMVAVDRDELLAMLDMIRDQQETLDFLEQLSDERDMQEKADSAYRDHLESERVSRHYDEPADGSAIPAYFFD